MHKHRGFDNTNVLWSWWKGDPLPPLAAFPGFSLEETTDPATIKKYMYISPEDSRQRMAIGHHAYLARVDNQPVAYGWSATDQAAFGSPSITFHLPPANRYLYHFVTLLPWRGKGLYPRLLQAIIRHEQATRFWIIHRQVNKASQRGIAKAGFQLIATIQPAAEHGLTLTAAHDTIRAQAAADMFGIPLKTPGT